MRYSGSLAAAVGVVAAAIAFGVYLPSSWSGAHPRDVTLRVFSAQDLAQLKESASRGETKLLLLVVLGEVFDVTAGRDFYGPGSEYEGFVFVDASRAFFDAFRLDPPG